MNRPVVGYLGWNIPVELVLAADATPVHLGSLSSDSTHLADHFLESSFSSESRVVAQQWLAGQLDSLDTMIFSRSDDSAQRLYYYLCELQRMGECKGPRPLLYDLAGIDRATSLAHTIESTRLLASALGTSESALSGAAERVAARDALLKQVGQYRTSDRPVSGIEAHRRLRAARSDWSNEYDQSLQAWLASAIALQRGKRFLLIGSAPRDETLHSAVESVDAVIVGEINAASFIASSLTASTRVGAETAIESVARRYHDQTNAIRSLTQSPAALVENARASRADGVIVWLLATDTGLAWQAPRIAHAFQEVGLPTLMLTSQPQTPDIETVNRIVEFARSPEAR